MEGKYRTTTKNERDEMIAYIEGFRPAKNFPLENDWAHFTGKKENLVLDIALPSFLPATIEHTMSIACVDMIFAFYILVTGYALTDASDEEVEAFEHTLNHHPDMYSAMEDLSEVIVALYEARDEDAVKIPAGMAHD
jgi:hypothetical protein